MTTLIIKSLLLSIVLSYTSAIIFTDLKSHFLLRSHFTLISLLENPFLLVNSAAPPEEGKKLKEKIKRGKELIEELNTCLENIRESLSEKKELDKDVLDKVVEIKDEFMQMQVDVSDLPKELIEKFKEKTLESFKLILESYGFSKLLEKKKPEILETVEEEMEPELEDNKVDNKVEKKFVEEL